MNIMTTFIYMESNKITEFLFLAPFLPFTIHKLDGNFFNVLFAKQYLLL